MKHLTLLFLLPLVALSAGAQGTLRSILELENVTPRMSTTEPYTDLTEVSFTVTGRWNGYPDMLLADYDAEKLATAATTVATAGGKAGVYTDTNTFVAPFRSITITGNDVVVAIPQLKEGNYRFHFPQHFFRSQLTADGYILTTPPMDLPYKIGKTYMPEVISVVGTFNDWDATATPLTYASDHAAWVGGFDLPGAGTYSFKFTDGDTYWRASELIYSGNTYALNTCEGGALGGMTITVGDDRHVEIIFQVNGSKVARFAIGTSVPDGIEGVCVAAAAKVSTAVDLQGRRVARQQRGVSIERGAKVLR